MKDQKHEVTKAPEPNYMQKLETATPTQVSQSIIAKILLKLKKLQGN